MKNISNVLIAVLFVAVAVLYFFYFHDRKPSGEQAAGDTIVAGLDAGAIAYVNSDSLLKNYEYFQEIQQKLIGKRDQLQKEYQSRAQGLQKEIATFQNTAGNMTMSQAQAVQEDLKRKQQNLMMYQDQLSQQLMKEENDMNSELYDKVANYLKQYGNDKGLLLVLTYSKGSGVLYANDTLDITNEVILGLNDEYKIKKADDKKAGTPK